MNKKSRLTEKEFKAALEIKAKDIKGEDVTDFEEEVYRNDAKGY